ncbi:antitoxin Xre/MbcA/ParS toxin-binding domain-containing protein [Pseudomonas sp. OTU5201]|uniref:antitoxin Xre/MbcA/ParS toxin-binding domain-containing protein n=1 Tax=Pseudomonas sp. OTU5201 TaxID=3043850 RepID=UPI00313AFB08
MNVARESSAAALEALAQRAAEQAAQAGVSAEACPVPGTSMTLNELLHAARRVPLLRKRPLVCRALGISERTLRRWLHEPSAHLRLAHGERFLRLIAITAHAEVVFGSGVAAERWFTVPAMGLNRQVPLDLIKEPADYEQLADFLTRLEYGVYQ